MYSEAMRHLAVVLAICLFTSAAHADICAKKTNLTTQPSTPLRSAVNGWFQWLNAGTASCSGSSTHMTCTKSGVSYTFDYLCPGSTCYVEAYQAGVWRNEASMNTGDVWGWAWDGWKNGYVQISCAAVNPGSPNVTCTYSTCD